MIEIQNPDATEVRINGLTTGLEYEFRVSALNDAGFGPQAAPDDSTGTTITLFEPGKPTNVRAYVKEGDDQRLMVYFEPPESDGGAEITQYVVELDPKIDFDFAVTEVYDCSIAPDYAVWAVATTCHNCTLVGGYFTLTVEHGGKEYTTDPIPYDAPPLAEDEEASPLALNSSVHCTLADGDNAEYCPTLRLRRSGSMQSKLNDLAGLEEGVDVTRRSLGGGSYVWSVTFLDLGDDFTVTTDEIDLQGRNNTEGGVSIVKLLDGDAHSNCTGHLAVPVDGGLIRGQQYYVRVTAYNQVGYGSAATYFDWVPQSGGATYAATAVAPCVVPGAPTDVKLSVLSQTSLRVDFEPPTDDGGDDITQYVISWSSDNDTFMQADNASVVLVAQGGPYSKVLTNLEKGVAVYVHVQAVNSQGAGPGAASAPARLAPHEEPANPLDVKLGVTSDSMLTVRWDPPGDDGGSAVLGYYVEWDTGNSFATTSRSPNKGAADVGAGQRAYTMDGLLENTKYYVRVAAYNAAGRGTYTLSYPTFEQPFIQNPGRPVNVTATPGGQPGTVNVSWDFPQIPFHGYPCYGTLDAPSTCATPFGKTRPEANGGSEITSYRVEWSIDPSFAQTESDSGFNSTAGSEFNYVIGNLTEAQTYYVRVASRNPVGYSLFCEQEGHNCLGAVQVNATTRATGII